jgi:hypothetical protein
MRVAGDYISFQRGFDGVIRIAVFVAAQIGKPLTKTGSVFSKDDRRLAQPLLCFLSPVCASFECIITGLGVDLAAMLELSFTWGEPMVSRAMLVMIETQWHVQ